jgi:hypothetical protein
VAAPKPAAVPPKPEPPQKKERALTPLEMAAVGATEPDADSSPTNPPPAMEAIEPKTIPPPPSTDPDPDLVVTTPGATQAPTEATPIATPSASSAGSIAAVVSKPTSHEITFGSLVARSVSLRPR